MGYGEAVISTDDGDRLLKETRNNDRIVFDDAALAHWLYDKAQPGLPALLDGWQLQGFNERLRFYRYEKQQYFKWHQDGTFRRSAHEESVLTFMIYLNDNFIGGHTEFRWDTVQPRAGMALVFPHRLSHQGSAVGAGVKYVLRTDVMYRDAAFAG
ncbi:2OG-Fe(II) oxygenase [Aquabacterium sp. A7-Y]|uniref:2OG-Fe(II) oxygenase n=1 Tax=Aquabacterium sp. A7-Y TaxID=1349605 RepID=UPI002AC890AF|nr:2OG-Fe(II) oxygenase [Aquabacterium sp. A7-Y]